ncbi:hypothetical protein JBO08_13940 [Pseudomonas sp. LAP_36]|uniref:Uncharacterized protein n=2 Tax=Pseudomonas TaxID=286 RepID=A0A8H9YUM7_9PSED|nr:hypothetical protein [Pseudomonas sp. SWRI144]MBW8128156.1 hypothetical protein [Pseudomonas sp. LAP_36]MBW8137109.1 hypothetical protein [Pseudomonas sp. PAMC 26818]QXH86523.1 hypothetical protein HU722_0000675 [Pseudomonas tritici]
MDQPQRPTQTAISIEVDIGAPTYIIYLRYEVLYDAKPFEDAVVYLYDNGVYKIISPGENHYGVYVIKGEISGERWEITFLSIPHPDWGGNVARHDLTFNRTSKVFGQQAYLQVDPDIPKQHGRFHVTSNNVIDPRPLTWDNIPHPKLDQR